MVTDRLNSNKPQNIPDPKNPKTGVNNNKDLDVDFKKEEPSFFGSFFGKDQPQKKKGAQSMEAVSG